MMETDEGPVEDFAHQFALRCDVASRFLQQFSTDNGARALVDVLIANEPERFNQFFDDFEVDEIPPLGRCIWGRDLIEIVGRHYASVTVCFLRDDLSPAERLLYFLIARRHHQAGLFEGSGAFSEQSSTNGIPEGPFLDELKANNLVRCEERLTDAPPVLGLPYEVCL